MRQTNVDECESEECVSCWCEECNKSRMKWHDHLGDGMIGSSPAWAWIEVATQLDAELRRREGK